MAPMRDGAMRPHRLLQCTEHSRTRYALDRVKVLIILTDVLSVFVACHSRSLFLPPLLPGAGRHVVRFCQSRTRAQGYDWLQAGKQKTKCFLFSSECFLFSSRPATRYLVLLSFTMFSLLIRIMYCPTLSNTVVRLTLSVRRERLRVGEVPNLPYGYRVSAPPLCCREPRLGAGHRHSLSCKQETHTQNRMMALSRLAAPAFDVRTRPSRAAESRSTRPALDTRARSAPLARIAPSAADPCLRALREAYPHASRPPVVRAMRQLCECTFYRDVVYSQRERDAFMRTLAAGAAAAVTLILVSVGSRPSSRTHVIRIQPVRRRPPQATAAAVSSVPSTRSPPHAASGPLLFDLDLPNQLSAAVASVSEGGEIIMLTSDWNGIGSAVNLVQQLRAWSLERRVLLLADRQETCARASATWAWLACGWSRGIPGFEHYATTGVVDLWTLWSAKWLVLARLVEMRANVLMTDSDMLFMANPYPLLHSEPLSRFALLLPPEGARVNVGWLYARGVGAHGGLPSVLWDMVRRLRLFLQQVVLRDRSGAPSVQGLWDQGLFSDALTSAVCGEHSYAFTWQHSPHAFASRAFGWPPDQFTPANGTALLRRLWRRSEEMRARRPHWLLPNLPPHHPQRGGWESQVPLLWNELKVLSPIAGLASSLLRARRDLLPGWKYNGAWWGRRSGGHDLVGAAPDWLTCTTGYWMVTAGWPAASRPVCAVLHLVECRSQFAHYSSLDTLKANRPYVMRAYGYWHAEADAHAPERAVPPPVRALRAIRLSASMLDAVGRSSAVGGLLNALQLLAALAAITGRTPVVPHVPCSSRWLRKHQMTLAGVADDYVLQLPLYRGGRVGGATKRAADAGGGGAGVGAAVDDGTGVRCHLAIGGAQCSQPRVLPGWLPLLPEGLPDGLPKGLPDEAAMVTPPELPASPIHLGGTPGGAREAASWPPSTTQIRELAHRLADVPMLEVSWAALSSAAGRAYRAAANRSTTDVSVTGEGGPGVNGRQGRVAHRSASRVADAEWMDAHRFACGEPASWVAALADGEALNSQERHELLKLQAACPAFFAERGTARRRLDWLHRRRSIQSCTA